MICLGFVVDMPLYLPAQSDTMNGQNLQALQKQLDAMTAQMESVQAQILELSKATSSTVKIPGAPRRQSYRASGDASQEENGAAQAAALNLVPARVGQTRQHVRRMPRIRLLHRASITLRSIQAFPAIFVSPAL